MDVLLEIILYIATPIIAKMKKYYFHFNCYYMHACMCVQVEQITLLSKPNELINEQTCEEILFS